MESTRGNENVSGTREELAAELRDRAEGWHHMASDKKRDRATEGALALEGGATSVTVGNTVYTVTGESIPKARDEKADDTVG